MQKQIDLKKHVAYLPETILLVGSLYVSIHGFCNSSFISSLIFLAFALACASLLKWKNPILASIVASITTLGVLYMLLALVSEFREFPPGETDGLKMLYTGLVLFLFILVFSLTLPIKYYKRQNSQIP